METHEIALHRVAPTQLCEEALAGLRTELGPESVEAPDETGMFAVEVEAESFDEAVQQVRDAIAALGADECIELGESSGVPPDA